ncbi:MAG: hypothetical protein V2J55_01260 [Candidatus Competibacteraceae bacterium]|nr:hypothetical protein [Candidatus Competibacteraceae bacterium]
MANSFVLSHAETADGLSAAKREQRVEATGRECRHTLFLLSTRAPSGEPVNVITTHTPTTALAEYKKSWERECLFAAMKRHGFNLEVTYITDPERLSRLVAVLTLALCWCYLEPTRTVFCAVLRLIL